MCRKLSCLAIVLIVAAGVVLLGTAIGLGVYFGTSKDKGQSDENTSTQPVIGIGPPTRPWPILNSNTSTQPVDITPPGPVLDPTRQPVVNIVPPPAPPGPIRLVIPRPELPTADELLTPKQKSLRDDIRGIIDRMVPYPLQTPGTGISYFSLGPFPASGEQRNAFSLRFTVTDCKDVDEAVDVKGKYWKLRVLYTLFDQSPSESLSGDAEDPGHVAKHCRSYGHTKTMAIQLWLVDEDGNKASASRRKFFNRFPMDDFMKATASGPDVVPRRPFWNQVIKRVDTIFLVPGGLPDEYVNLFLTTASIERVLIGHGDAGPGALALFTSYPHEFKTAVLVDPAFCDAATRVTLQTAETEKGDGDEEEFTLALDRTQAATDDEKSTSELFAAIRGQASAKPKAKAAYKKYRDYLNRLANTTGDDVLQNGDDILKLAKAGNKLPTKLQNEYERTLTALQDAFAKNNKRNLAHFLDDNTGKAGPWDKTANEKAKKWAPLRILDATKNRLYRTRMLRKLGKAQSKLEQEAARYEPGEWQIPASLKFDRKLIMSVGDGLPRPWGSEEDPASEMGFAVRETDNPFDMIPWQVYLWEHALLKAKMPRLEVKDVMAVPGGHREAVAPTIERVLKVEDGKTMLDD